LDAIRAVKGVHNNMVMLVHSQRRRKHPCFI
jgi:hypothetical protein